MEKNELIEQYLSGRMSENDMVEFEQMLSTDPLLNKEFLFQQDIVQAIQETRKQELITKLDAIDVSGLTDTSGLLNLKTIAAASVLIIGGVVSYFMLSGDDVTPENDQISTIEIVEEPKESSNVSTVTIEESASSDESFDVQPEDVIEEEKLEDESTVTSISISKDELDAINSSEINDDFGDFDDDDFNLSGPPENFMNSKGEFEHSTIGVIISNNKKKYSFHYQIKDNTLFLFGNFDKVYEVLEFNTGNSSDLFFVYEDKYYNLNEAQSSIAPLEEMDLEETMELKQKMNSTGAAKGQ